MEESVLVKQEISQLSKILEKFVEFQQASIERLAGQDSVLNTFVERQVKQEALLNAVIERQTRGPSWHFAR